jgi:hypothetical protein
LLSIDEHIIASSVFFFAGEEKQGEKGKSRQERKELPSPKLRTSGHFESGYAASHP